MMPVIRVNDATFADLSTLKTWYDTKTPSETIDRLVQIAMEELGIERGEGSGEDAATASNGAMQFDTAPGLAFTKPLAASINGHSPQNLNWSAILLAVISQVKAKGSKGEDLVRQLSIPARATQYEEDGFKYHPDLGISLQGQSASDCWKEVDRLAKKWRIPVVVEFRWRDNPKAQYPGRIGILRSGGAK
ncbi:T4SS efffector SepA family protein [Amorphus coralli]|uniref:T4SS efffector SepA family protein n=1 Tax=Amorphus coralli TaxID=340680 RepID=UPI0004771AEA|nr:hypothetical protein [Amorphus coralli]